MKSHADNQTELLGKVIEDKRKQRHTMLEDISSTTSKPQTSMQIVSVLKTGFMWEL